MSLCMITFVNELKKVYDFLWFIPTIKQTNHDKTELPMSYNFILVISWRSGLFVADTGVSGENHRPVASH